MSGGNLQRLKECLVELRLPTFREHHGSQAALATKESWSYPQYLLALVGAGSRGSTGTTDPETTTDLETSLGQDPDFIGSLTTPAECGPAVVRIGGGRLPGPSRKSTCVR